MPARPALSVDRPPNATSLSTTARLVLALALPLVLGSPGVAPAGDIFDGPRLDPRQPVERLAFGSCADQNRPQPIWNAVASTQPQVFLFIGDNIYSDTVDMDRMAEDYETLAAVPEFAALRAKVPILATWDDHDYGANDAGAEYPKKAEAAELLLNFFGEPPDSLRRQRPGIYDAQIYGPPGQRVQILLLDARTFRSPLTQDPSPLRRYRPNLDPAATMLGSAQWSWLAEQLRRPAELRLIVSGVQVLGYAAGFESWKTLPLELERLYGVIRDAEADGVVFLSGDAHFTQLKRTDGGVGYPVYDFTSSGLTHSRPGSADRPSPLAIHRPYGGLNFGTITIDWDREDPEIVLAARDRDASVVFEHRLRLSELRAWREDMDRP
ncbi:MAG: alkaline phosphatase D family protein [Acidobacteriota bacterium]